MAYEFFKKTKERKRRTHEEKPMMIYMDKRGRLTLNQGFFPILIENEFHQAAVMIDYQSKKIGLKLLKEGDYDMPVKKIFLQPNRTRLTFISFVAEKNSLKLEYPFSRSATWDQKNHMIEFSFKEEKHA